MVRQIKRCYFVCDSLILHAGFTIALYEFEATIPTLWNTVKSRYLAAHFSFYKHPLTAPGRFHPTKS